MRAGDLLQGLQPLCKIRNFGQAGRLIQQSAGSGEAVLLLAVFADFYKSGGCGGGVLLEIPVDVAFSLALLWVCGHTLNLMSAIGLIVTCGIIINDSILKLDAINELRKAGTPLMEAIHEAGRRRLRPIIMTSLTTIFAMVPLLFSYDMGSELQKPLSIAMIGAMLIGTMVSLFIIPLIYWFIYKEKKIKV